MNKLITEFIGTFFLAVTVATAAVLGGSTFAAFAIASVLMVMVYAGGHVSGAHYNPAVTLAVTLRGKAEMKDMAPYIIVQLLAAVAAAFVAKQILPPEKAIEALAFQSSTPVILSELLYTFALAYVVLNVATAKSTANNSFYGLAIGFTVLVGAITVGGISGGAFNPAVTTLLIVMGKLKAADSWMHFLPQIIGAIAAAFVFKTVNPTDK